MRSPHFITVAVRKSNRKISLQFESFKSLLERFPFLRKPLLRGIVILFESLIKGTQALSFSASVASEPELEGKPLSNWAIAGSIISAFALGIGLFVVLPHFLTALIVSQAKTQTTADSPLFHLLDGFLKVLILLIYVYCISWMKDIRRVFQYHGAEHKSIYTFEAGEELTVENARKHSTLHPRCGTSFLLFLVLISILVFSVIFPLFELTRLSNTPLVNHSLMITIKIFLMFPVAGLAYEFIKFCSFKIKKPIFYFLIWPGLMLQKLTTREPDDDQLEVALASLRQVLLLEKQEQESFAQKSSIEINALSELVPVEVVLSEFQEI